MKEVFRRAEEFVLNQYSKVYLPGHDWLHTCRVRNLALFIAEDFDVDRHALELAALFHDVGRVEGDENHASASARIAKDFLSDFELEVDFVDIVVRSVGEHEGINEPTYLEGKILQDADKLDGMGAIGLIRIAKAAVSKRAIEYDEKNPFGIGYCGNLNEWIEENIGQMPNKNLRVDEYIIEEIIGKEMQWINMLWTEKARKMAERRFNLMKTFLKELEMDLGESGVLK